MTDTREQADPDTPGEMTADELLLQFAEYLEDMAARPPEPPPTEAELAAMFQALGVGDPFRW